MLVSTAMSLNSCTNASAKPSQAMLKRSTLKTMYLLRQLLDGPHGPKKRNKRRLKDLIQLWFNTHGESLRDVQRRFSQLKSENHVTHRPTHSRFTPHVCFPFHDERRRRFDVTKNSWAPNYFYGNALCTPFARSFSRRN